MNFLIGYPTPPTATDRPERPSQRPPSIKVVINSPQIKIVEIGETTQLGCNGYLVLNNVSLKHKHNLLQTIE